MKILLALVVLLIALAGASSYQLSRPLFDETLDENAFEQVQIAPRDQALTLARTRSGAVLLVTGADARGVTAIDITAVTGRAYADGLAVYRHLGATGLLALYDQSTSSFPWVELKTPLDGHYPHIAAGTNYRAHAEEVGLDGQPFLFPKLSRATAWNSAVSPGGRLDYEVELCAVPLDDYRRGTAVALGYLLCGDFTDRWTLMRHIDTSRAMGQTGFPAAKGGETRLPVGPLLVVPFAEDFYRRIQLSLYVNDALRQRATAGQMLWAPAQTLSAALADCQSSYLLGEQTIRLADCEAIAAGTLVLTGTPEGVMFHLGTIWNPWAYLREGDVVRSRGTYLGFMRNRIQGGGG